MTDSTPCRRCEHPREFRNGASTHDGVRSMLHPLGGCQYEGCDCEGFLQ